MKTHKLFKHVGILIAIVLLGITMGACGKKDKRNTAVGPYNNGYYNPGSIPGGGSYLTNATGSDGIPSIVLELDFFGNLQQGANFSSYYGPINVQGRLVFPSRPVGCFGFQQYGPNSVPVYGQGTLSSTLIDQMELKDSSGRTIALIQGRLRPAPGSIGYDGRTYSYRLDIDIYDGYCTAVLN